MILRWRRTSHGSHTLKSVWKRTAWCLSTIILTKTNFLLSIKRLFQNLSDSFHQDAFCNISNPESKLWTYGLLKKSIGIESYLTHINNPEIRCMVIKFRLSNHRLNIETGRHKNIPKELRFCHFCRNTVESELHFLIECPTYRILRKELINMTTTKKPFFAYYTQIEKFQYLLSDENIRVTPRYIHSSLEIWEFLIKHPKKTRLKSHTPLYVFAYYVYLLW